MIFIVIPTFNSIDRLRSSLQSLFAAIGERQHGYKVVVVDDRSTDGTREYLEQEYANIEYIRGSGELFWGGAVSLGINCILNELAPTDWVFVLNPDVEINENLFKKFDISSASGAGLISCLAVNKTDKNSIIKSGTIMRSWFWNVSKHIYVGCDIDNVPSNQIHCDLLAGRALFISGTALMSVGNFASHRYRHYCADDEYSVRVKKMGFDVVVDTTLIVFLDIASTGNRKTVFNDGIGVIPKRLFGRRSSGNLIDKTRFALDCVPIEARATYLLMGFFKTLCLCFIKER